MRTLAIVVLLMLAVPAGNGIAADARKTLKYTGIVQEIDAANRTLVAVKENRDLGMLFDASAASWTNVQGLEDLQPGDRVVVEYDAVKSKTIAVTVTRTK